MSEDQPSAAPLTTVQLRERGNELFRQKEYSAAAECYTQALDLLRELPTAAAEDAAALWSNRAACSLAMGDAEAAIRECSSALDLQPRYVKALYRRHSALLACDRREEAVEDLRKVLEIEPGNAAATKALAALLARASEDEPLQVVPVKFRSEPLRHPAVTAAHLPSPFKQHTYVPSPDGVDSNVIVFLHGVGDTHANFANLARRMALPQTACVALQAPLALPLELGWWWFPAPIPGLEEVLDEDEFDAATLAPGLQRATTALLKLIDKLQDELGYPRSSTFLYGFSQGACLALSAALASTAPLGGVVGVSVSELPILQSLLESTGVTLPASLDVTPVILTHGERDTSPTVSSVREALRSIEALRPGRCQVALSTFPKAHEMVNSEPESRCIMEFFASHLRRRQPQLEGQDGVFEVKRR